MKIVRRTATAIATIALGLTICAAPAQAGADTSWGGFKYTPGTTR